MAAHTHGVKRRGATIMRRAALALFAGPATMYMLTYATISAVTLLTYLKGDGVGLPWAQRRWWAIRECSGGAMPTTSPRDQPFPPACRPSTMRAVFQRPSAMISCVGAPAAAMRRVGEKPCNQPRATLVSEVRYSGQG